MKKRGIGIVHDLFSYHPNIFFVEISKRIHVATNTMEKTRIDTGSTITRSNGSNSSTITATITAEATIVDGATIHEPSFNP